MTEPDARALVLRCLGDIAPEADLAALPAGADLRETLDLDSMDFFNLVAALADGSGAVIPDADARQLTTLDGAVGYLAGHAP
jgi:acyl carrier protein